MILLQKWLLAVPDTHLKNWKAADFYADDRITGKNTIFNFNQIKKFRDSRNLIAFVIYTNLSEYNSCLIRPCTDYVNETVIIHSAATNCFSIQTYDFILFCLKYRLYPVPETFFQLFRLDNCENPLKCIICQYSILFLLYFFSQL